MKKFFIIFLIVFAFSYSLQAQTLDPSEGIPEPGKHIIDTVKHDIFTPFCTPVPTWDLIESSYKTNLGLDG